MQMTTASAKQKPTPYASPEDFCRVFLEDMTGLYLLAFLLTADGPKAEQCFVSALEDSKKGNTVFKEWAHSWARRTIIQNAVRLINPRPTAEHANVLVISANGGEQIAWRKQTELPAILDLPAFERFVFVMSVLPGYSDQYCSVLLGCTRRDVVAARSRVRSMPQFVESSSQTAQETSGGDEFLFCESESSRRIRQAAHA